jgi:Tfp pilus assembly protein PilF
MSRSSSSHTSNPVLSGPTPRSTGAPIARSWRRRVPALAAGATALVLGGAVVSWQRHRQTALAPAPAAALGTSPLETRLLSEARSQPASPRPYVDLAEEYAASARPASALWAYSEAEARAPTDGAIRLKLALTVKQLGFPASAAALLKEIASQRGAAASGARLELAELLLSTGRPGQALAALKPAGPEADLIRGRAYEALGDLATAAQSYRRAGAAGDAAGDERLARLWLAAGNAAAARKVLQSLVVNRSGRPADLLLVAEVQAAPGTHAALEAAIHTLLRYAQQHPGDAELYYQAALIFLKQGDRPSALAQLERAVKLDPQHAAARLALADQLEASGQVARSHRQRAAYYELKDQPDRSLAELRRAGAAGYPDDLERTLEAARTASELELLPAAVQEAKEGLKRHPGDPHLMTQLGLLYRHPLGASRGALEQLCREWMARDPSAGEPYWLLGHLEVTGSHMDQALRDFQTACKKEPNRADFCTSLGVAYLGRGTPEGMREARVWLEKAITLDPRQSTAHRQLARVLEQAGDLEGARRQYLQSLDIEPAQPGVYNSLAQLAARLKRPELVRLFADFVSSAELQISDRKNLERRVRVRPDDGAARIGLARMLIGQGQLDTARNQLERAAESGPESQQARRELAAIERLLRVENG